MRSLARLGRLLGCVLLAGAAALPAYADSADEVARLRQEAARLRQAVDELEARIQALEQGMPAPARKAAAEAGTSRPSYIALQRDWSEISPGTPKARVEELLGRPKQELRINGDLAWYFVYPGLGRGSVFFNDAGKVTAVQPPRVGWGL